MENINIEKLIKPETDLERKIITNEEWIEGALQGKPRKGHPEGQIAYHIAEVLANVDKYCDENNRADLRLIAIIHDTFKHKVDRNKPKIAENHHAMIARRFAEKIGITNQEVLKIIELHDEAYNSWRNGNKNRIVNLIKRLNNSTKLFCIFYQCDNETGNKSNDDVEWFKNILNKIKTENNENI